MKTRRTMNVLALALLGILAALAVGTVARDAGATAPGENGRIAFRRYFDKDNTTGAIFVMAPDGTGSRQLTRPPRGFLDQTEDWSPNGSLIVFQRCSATTPCAIYTVKADGTRLKRLSWAPGTGGKLLSDDQAPTFTSDGRHVVFTRASGGIHPKVDQIKHSDLVVMDLSGNNRRIVVRAPQYKADYENASFSPDGSKLVYEHRRSQLVDPQTRRALVVSSADGKRQQQITPWSLNAATAPIGLRRGRGFSSAPTRTTTSGRNLSFTRSVPTEPNCSSSRSSPTEHSSSPPASRRTANRSCSVWAVRVGRPTSSS